MTWVVAVALTTLLLGLAGAGFTFVMNGYTPLQLGPVPFFLGGLLALASLIVLVVVATGS